MNISITVMDLELAQDNSHFVNKGLVDKLSPIY